MKTCKFFPDNSVPYLIVQSLKVDDFSVCLTFNPTILLRLSLLHIQLQRRSNNFHELTIKNDKDCEIETLTNANTNNYDVFRMYWLI